VTRYFAYGSNLVIERMRERGADFTAARPAVLRDHRLVFDKRSSDGTSRANVERSVGARVYGVVYEMAADGLRALQQFESGYDLVEVLVQSARADGGVEVVPAKTFLARPDRRISADPSKSYLHMILEGARQHGLPDAAREEILRAAKRKPDPTDL
jgi:gamma-glutamylcyclotransferase